MKSAKRFHQAEEKARRIKTELKKNKGKSRYAAKRARRFSGDFSGSPFREVEAAPAKPVPADTRREAEFPFYAGADYREVVNV